MEDPTSGKVREAAKLPTVDTDYMFSGMAAMQWTVGTEKTFTNRRYVSE